jgi:hypothetical protein
MAAIVTASRLVDTDVHVYPLGLDDLLPYLDEHWREYSTKTGFHGATESAYPPAAPNTGAADAETLARRASLEAAAFADGRPERTILACTYAVEGIRNPYAALAMS